MTTTVKKAATTKKPSKKKKAIPPQIVPGWYMVLQETTYGEGTWFEVGWVEVKDAGAGDGSSYETWYLYAETIGTRKAYRYVGTTNYDALRFQRINTTPAQPVGIRSIKIVTRCEAPVVVGP